MLTKEQAEEELAVVQDAINSLQSRADELRDLIAAHEKLQETVQ